MKFAVHALQNEQPVLLFYDSETNLVTDKKGNLLLEPQGDPDVAITDFSSKCNPIERKSHMEVVHLMLGTNCNNNCTFCEVRLQQFYCSSIKDVDSFVERLRASSVTFERVRLWGGEPLVYWKTLKRLLPALKEYLPNVKFSLVTNGFLLSKEKVDWMLDNSVDQISVSVEPFDCNDRNEKNLMLSQEGVDTLRYLKDKLKNRFSLFVTLMPTKTNIESTIRPFQDILGFDTNFCLIPLKCRSVLTWYSKKDVDELSSSIFHHYNERKPFEIGFADYFYRTFFGRLIRGSGVESVRTYCVMPYSSVTLDLQGGVYSCHVRANKQGDISNLRELKMVGQFHWKERESCKRCPYLQMCGGLCSSLEQGDSFNCTCHNWRGMMDGVFRAVFGSLFGVYIEKISPFEQ